MNKLYYRYEMGAEFDPAVKDHFVNLRCVPMTNAIQQVYGSQVQIEDADYVCQKTDGQGNQLTSCRIQALHTRFSMISQGIVFVDVNALEKEALEPCYGYFTDYTRPDDGLRSFFEESCRPVLAQGGTVWEQVREMMHVLYQHFSYEAGITSVSTTAAEAFSLGKGVCQDYAQILITLCRMQGVFARYVSGFMTGEGATHAWVEIYDNGYWYGFDPTHDRTITNYYIKVAHGRDSADCPMERGVFRGRTSQKNWVKVLVQEHGAHVQPEGENTYDRNGCISRTAGGRASGCEEESSAAGGTDWK